MKAGGREVVHVRRVRRGLRLYALFMLLFFRYMVMALVFYLFFLLTFFLSGELMIRFFSHFLGRYIFFFSFFRFITILAITVKHYCLRHPLQRP